LSFHHITRSDPKVYQKMQITQVKLHNNITLLTDYNPSVESVTIHIGFGVGSIHENKSENGISHFIEHMIFKGTKKRDAQTIAKDFEAIGGYFNAFTSRDKTMYYCKSLKEDFRSAMEIISDIVINSTFSQEEADRERHVILQELANSIDTPDDIIHDYFQELAFPDQSFGQPILGPKENILAFSQESLKAYYQNYYCGDNTVISVSGNVPHEEVLSECKKYFDSLPTNKQMAKVTPIYQGGVKEHQKDIEQMQIVLGYQSVALTHKDFYPLQLYNYILGEGMSSRLFQEVREKQGLAYSVYSFNCSFQDAGIFGIHTSIAPKNKEKTIALVRDVMLDTSTSISDDDLAKAIKSFRSNLLMNLESSVARSRRMASSFLSRGKFITNDELLESFQNVSKQDIKVAVDNLLKSKETLVTLGNQ
jgi:predicted Zn-dependent peptidase